MKLKPLIYGAAIATLLFTSCKKDNTTTTDPNEIANTTQASEDLAISDNISEDVNNSFMMAASDNALMGARPTSPQDCYSVDISSGGFPKTITITFYNTACLNGITRSGSINVVLSDSVRKAGSTATLTFNNYYVAGFHREGTIVWTNTRSGNTLSWSRVDSGKVTAPGGRFWYVSGTKNVTVTAGSNTPFDISDDVYSITGNRTWTSDSGIVRTATVPNSAPLEKKASCAFIDMGQLKIQGPNHYITIDYGTGTCDAAATYSIDGGTAHDFVLW
ncbi:hypothetical protein [Ferruginibacter albus]|uniref:hypothetical protein n=1 Tax=Ferruginibacter albus TaxID=2875540 RepID=UPI001CC380A4|nr:hypothetical protein [Ferruginibacter albus]UAY52754.1 hypothetical protein K9M53_03455 [Ferruginibacter albus]